MRSASTCTRLSAVLGIAIVCLVAPGPANACDPPSAPVVSISLPRFYADKAGSEVDAELKAEHAAAVAPLTDFLRHVTTDADRAMRPTAARTQDASARCAVAWLAAWARGGALLGRMETRQAEYQRKFDFTGLALAWLKVRDRASQDERKVIDAWLIRLADASRAFFDDPARKRNNHWYWLGAGLAATAHATGSEKHWQAARAIFADAAREITPEGYLPMELERRSRALYYHAFALMPLVVMAELAAVRGEDWAAVGNGALHRLVARTLEGLDDPAAFDRLAGTAQERPLKPGAGWLPLYLLRHGDRVGPRTAAMAPGHRWLGGDVRSLAAALKSGAR